MNEFLKNLKVFEKQLKGTSFIFEKIKNILNKKKEKLYFTGVAAAAAKKEGEPAKKEEGKPAEKEDDEPTEKKGEEKGEEKDHDGDDDEEEAAEEDDKEDTDEARPC